MRRPVDIKKREKEREDEHEDKQEITIEMILAVQILVVVIYILICHMVVSYLWDKRIRLLQCYDIPTRVETKIFLFRIFAKIA